MIKILLIFGTRPEAIKMAPLIMELKKYKTEIEVKVCVTAQHREMLDQVLEFFKIQPDFDLDLMQPGQNLSDLTAKVLTSMQSVFNEYRPDYAFVHGDTTTSTAAALAAFYADVKICHVEAGLRTYNKHSPFPEEMNRQLTSRLADIHFAPTEESKNNLLNEGIPESSILVTGNTVIDALFYAKDHVDDIMDDQIEGLKTIIDTSKDIILVTGHRRENFGEGFLKICKALSEISKLKNVQVVYPVHLNPNVQKPVNDFLGSMENVKLIKPLNYQSFIWLMKKAKLIITDSGGVQEEAPSLGKPVLVMRDTTERPEAVLAGTVVLVGTDSDKIVSECHLLLTNSNEYKRRTQLNNPYGNGSASESIVNFMLSLSDK